MFELLGFIVIVGTLVIAGRQGENEMGKVFLILLCGFMQELDQKSHFLLFPKLVLLLHRYWLAMLYSHHMQLSQR